MRPEDVSAQKCWTSKASKQRYRFHSSIKELAIRSDAGCQDCQFADSPRDGLIALNNEIISSTSQSFGDTLLQVPQGLC